jgi:serine/threonine-protein kinase HipA
LARREVNYGELTKANVYLRRRLVGTLEKQSAKKYVFRYDEAYVAQSEEHAIAISQSLPTSVLEHTSDSLHPFFDNLILEGWLLRQAETTLHIEKSNRFALLMATGRNTIGAVHVHALERNGTEIPDVEFVDSSAEKLMNCAMKSPFKKFCPACLRASDQGSMHAKCRNNLWGTSKKIDILLDGQDPLQSFADTIHGGSISGVQRKGLFVFDKARAALVPGATDSTHILKPEGDYPELPANEHLTMAIAQRLKFDVPPMAVFETKSLGLVYVVKRFDRVGSEMLLKEDAAQLLQLTSEDKYQGSLERAAKAIAKVTTKLDLNDFFRRVLFCFVTGNGDMHLKNWAVLERASLKGEMQLSPCYDFVNTRLVLRREVIDIGLTIGGKQRHLRGSYFRNFGIDSLHLAERYVAAVFSELREWQKVVEEMVPHSALSRPMQKRYLEITRERFAEAQL